MTLLEISIGKTSWVADASRSRCLSCRAVFGLSNRRHHCRLCGEIFCHSCTRRRCQGSRVCDPCFGKYIGPPLSANLLTPIMAWIPDNMRLSCLNCNLAFGSLLRRHHCRLCGEIFCSSCSQNEYVLASPNEEQKPGQSSNLTVRACNYCWQHIPMIESNTQLSNIPDISINNQKTESKQITFVVNTCCTTGCKLPPSTGEYCDFHAPVTEDEIDDFVMNAKELRLKRAVVLTAEHLVHLSSQQALAGSLAITVWVRTLQIAASWAEASSEELSESEGDELQFNTDDDEESAPCGAKFSGVTESVKKSRFRGVSVVIAQSRRRVSVAVTEAAQKASGNGSLLRRNG